jgi:iron complex outermembrane receptor protein
MSVLRVILAVTFLLASAPMRPAMAAGNGSLRGTVVDTGGAPVASATVTIHPTGRTARSDVRGAFEFSDLAPNAYDVVVEKPGYVTATYGGVVVGASGATLAVSLSPATFATLQQIASVRAQEYGSFNTGSSSIQNLSQQDFVDQGQLQIGHVLDQIPGVVSARPGSGNAAVPGSITSPNLRGTLDYEKATLIDGFPLINGSHGDYPTMFVNSLLFDDVEVVKGPTAFAPEINYGIGGTLNFRTGNPTATFTGSVLYGVDLT